MVDVSHLLLFGKLNLGDDDDDDDSVFRVYEPCSWEVSLVRALGSLAVFAGPLFGRLEGRRGRLDALEIQFVKPQLCVFKRCGLWLMAVALCSTNE